MKVLLGYTGLVGSNLNHAYFDVLLNRSNLDSFIQQGVEVKELWIAAGDARKWFAFAEPKLFEEDSISLTKKIICLNPHKAILFSTIDVFDGECFVNEDFIPRPSHPYGRVQLQREITLNEELGTLSIVRLPGLFGNNLQKNLIFDLLNDRKSFIENLNGFSTFQYFDLRLLHNLVFTLKADVINLVTEPVSVLDIYNCYSRVFEEKYEFKGKSLVTYNVMTSQTHSGYFHTKDFVIQRLYDFFKENKR
jgi:hypothetical protein